MYKISEEQKRNILNFLLDCPTRWGMPISNLINSLEKIDEGTKEEKSGNKKPPV